MSPEPEAEVAGTQRPAPDGESETPRPVLAGRRQAILDDGRYLIYYTFEEAAPAGPTQ